MNDLPIPSLAENFILAEADDLSSISVDYMRAARGGFFNGRPIKHEQAKFYGRDFAQRSDALYLIAPLLRDYLAQAIEAQRAETPQSGSVHESAVAASDVPTPNSISGDTNP